MKKVLNMEYEDIIVEAKERFAIVTLNRPHKKNAMGERLRSELIHFLQEQAPTFKAVVLTGAGDCFCSGMDQSETTGVEPTYHMWRVMKLIVDSPAIFIAAVNDRALGGGVTFVNVCDLALAEDHAYFSLPEVKHGIVGPAASPTTLQAIDRKVAAYMILTGQPISAAKAEQCNLINQVVTKGELLATATQWAQQLAQLPTQALAHAKKAIWQISLPDNHHDYGVHTAVDINRSMRSR